MKYAFLLLPALLAASPAFAQATPPPEPASGDTRLLFSDRDYPAVAAKNGEQGTVQAELTVGTDGRVKACKILRSSNSVSLDTVTCNILTARARFKPATDSNGNPREDRYVTPPITWRLAGESEPAPAAVPMIETQPGRYICNAPAGEFIRQDIDPLRPGQKLQFGVRFLKDNFHPDYAPAASIILGVPDGRVKVTVGEAQNDRSHLYVAFQPVGSGYQTALIEFPLTSNWIMVELSLDKWGVLTIRNGNLVERIILDTKQVTKTTLHCNSGEFQMLVSPPGQMPGRVK